MGSWCHPKIPINGIVQRQQWDKDNTTLLLGINCGETAILWQNLLAKVDKIVFLLGLTLFKLTVEIHLGNEKLMNTDPVKVKVNVFLT